MTLFYTRNVDGDHTELPENLVMIEQTVHKLHVFKLFTYPQRQTDRQTDRPTDRAVALLAYRKAGPVIMLQKCGKANNRLRYNTVSRTMLRNAYFEITVWSTDFVVTHARFSKF